jgi:hypothetical protein
LLIIIKAITGHQIYSSKTKQVFGWWWRKPVKSSDGRTFQFMICLLAHKLWLKLVRHLLLFNYEGSVFLLLQFADIRNNYLIRVHGPELENLIQTNTIEVRKRRQLLRFRSKLNNKLFIVYWRWTENCYNSHVFLLRIVKTYLFWARSIDSLFQHFEQLSGFEQIIITFPGLFVAGIVR